jgi:hypothetical protein
MQKVVLALVLTVFLTGCQTSRVIDAWEDVDRSPVERVKSLRGLEIWGDLTHYVSYDLEEWDAELRKQFKTDEAMRNCMKARQLGYDACVQSNLDLSDRWKILELKYGVPKKDLESQYDHGEASVDLQKDVEKYRLKEWLKCMKAGDGGSLNCLLRVFHISFKEELKAVAVYNRYGGLEALSEGRKDFDLEEFQKHDVYLPDDAFSKVKTHDREGYLVVSSLTDKTKDMCALILPVTSNKDRKTILGYTILYFKF